MTHVPFRMMYIRPYDNRILCLFSLIAAKQSDQFALTYLHAKVDIFMHLNPSIDGQQAELVWIKNLCALLDQLTNILILFPKVIVVKSMCFSLDWKYT
jgi:hypothetical protein